MTNEGVLNVVYYFEIPELSSKDQARLDLFITSNLPHSFMLHPPVPYLEILHQQRPPLRNGRPLEHTPFPHILVLGLSPAPQSARDST